MRFYDLKHIKKIIKKAAKYAQKLVFIGAMISNHPDFAEICFYLKKLKEKKDIKIEFSSMGFENHCEYLPNIIDEKTVSLALEVGSEKLRFEIGKNITNQKIIDTISFYAQRGIEKINLYSMIGLPNETDEDINAYIEFSKNLAKEFSEVKFTHIISAFIPKPSTPFERMPRKSNAELRISIDRIKQAFDELEIEYCLPILHNDSFNTLISQGDRRLGKFIKHIFEKNTPVKNMMIEYRKFMNKHNQHILPEEYLPHYAEYIYKDKNDGRILPWEYIVWDK